MAGTLSIKEKLEILADAAKYDASCASSGSLRKRAKEGLGNVTGMGICHSFTPDGRCISLLKILLTNHCIYDCSYCVNRISNDTKRASFTPEEVAWLTYEFYKRNYIEGLFLSSGIQRSPDYTMELLYRAAELLRKKYHFNGYIHLKAVAGASPEALAKAGRVADRLSANIELPTQSSLDKLAPGKTHETIETSMSAIKDEKKELSENKPYLKFAPAGQTTQLIVGATLESDEDILGKADQLYKSYELKRVYYTGYVPVTKSSGLTEERPPLVRENRLYQADWLMRFYGFTKAEIVNKEQPMLDLKLDPKLSWALRSRSFFPVDINKATREDLLRIPGLGVRNVDRIVELRKLKSLTLLDLKCLRVNLSKARFFIETSDHNPHLRLLDSLNLTEIFTAPKPQQLDLFATPAEALTGEI